MSPRHPSDSLLADYATGELPHAAEVAIAAHIQHCPRCDLQVRRIEEAEGRLLTATQAVPLASNALADVLGRLDAKTVSNPSPNPLVVGDVTVPSAAARAGLGPRRWIAPGLWAAPIRTSPHDAWRAILLRAPAGTLIPSHMHAGREYIAVLVGRLVDGLEYGPGDFAENSAGSAHDLRVSEDGACACVVSTEGRLQWGGWGRAIWPLLGL